MRQKGKELGADEQLSKPEIGHLITVMDELLARFKKSVQSAVRRTLRMEKYVLTQDLVTGNELIDSEHRKIFDEVNTLLDACSKGKGKRKSLKSGRICLLNM